MSERDRKLSKRYFEILRNSYAGEKWGGGEEGVGGMSIVTSRTGRKWRDHAKTDLSGRWGTSIFSQSGGTPGKYNWRKEEEEEEGNNIMRVRHIKQK